MHPPIFRKDDLDRETERFPPAVRADPAATRISQAAAILRHFVGAEWVDTYVFKRANHHPASDYLHITMIPNDEQKERVRRLQDFAEALFNLQGATGFYERVEELKKGEVESTVAEFEVARLLAIHEVPFRFIKPSGVEGGVNYDLEVAYPDGRIACADAKCRLESTEIRPETLRHVFKHGCKQLPSDQPGIIFLKVPAKWIQTRGMRQAFEAEIRRCLRGTGRLVSIIPFALVPTLTDDQTMVWVDFRHHEYLSTNHRFRHIAQDWTLLPDIDLPPDWDGLPKGWARVFSMGGNADEIRAAIGKPDE